MAFAVDGIWIRQCVAFIIEVLWYRASRVHGRGRISEGVAALQTRPRLLTLAGTSCDARRASRARRSLLGPLSAARYGAGLPT
jgi:hypothetical protein